MDPNLQKLLKWGIANSGPARTDEAADPNHPQPSSRGLDEQALKALMGGPSDADLMRDSMAAIVDPDDTLENKLVAFDNFEQLIETIDNANNMGPLGLWTPLVGQLDAEEAQLRKMAAWCIGTAVQNNEKAQETALAVGALAKLLGMVVGEKDATARRKAVYALSSEVRNYQPATDLMVEKLPEDILGEGKQGMDATNMDAIDSVMETLRCLAKEGI